MISIFKKPERLQDHPTPHPLTQSVGPPESKGNLHLSVNGEDASQVTITIPRIVAPSKIVIGVYRSRIEE